MPESINKLLKTQDVIGKPVLSLQGDDLGTVSKIVVDPLERSVVGITINVKGLFKGEKSAEYKTIKSFGDYAVMLNTPDELDNFDQLENFEKLAKDHCLFNIRIISPEGKLIGTIDDFYFNPLNGKIEKLILSGGIIKTLIKGRAVVPAEYIETIGKDAVITVNGIEEAIVREDSDLQNSIEYIKEDLSHYREDIDLFKDDIEQWRGDFDRLWEKTKKNAAGLSKTVADNLKEAAKSGKGKSINLLSKTTEILTEKAAQLKSSYEWWMERLQSVKNVSGVYLSADDIEVLTGLRAGKKVLDSSGKVIIDENEEVTPEMIDEAAKAGVTRDLLISLATRDLEDKMKSVEKAHN